MLVIKRGVGEGVVIGTGPTAVRVSIQRLCGKQVRIGVHAPADVAIRRDELVPAETMRAILEADRKAVGA